MKTKTILAAAASAAVCGAFLLAATRPNTLGAIDQEAPPAGQGWPLLTAAKHGPLPSVVEMEGCRFELSVGKGAGEAGQSAVLVLRADNPSPRPVKQRLHLEVLESTPPPPFARVLIAPRPIWSGDRLLELAARSSRTVQIDTGAIPAAEAELSLTLRTGE